MKRLNVPSHRTLLNRDSREEARSGGKVIERCGCCSYNDEEDDDDDGELNQSHDTRNHLQLRIHGQLELEVVVIKCH